MSTPHSTSPGTGDYPIFCTCPTLLYLCAYLSFFFLTCPSLSSFWDPFIPHDPTKCHPLWSWHPDHPGPSLFLLHLSSQCSLLIPPYWSLPHFSLCCIFFYILVCPHHLLSYLTSDWKLLEGCQWALFIFVYPMVVSTTHDKKTKSMCGIKECKPICFPG